MRNLCVRGSVSPVANIVQRSYVSLFNAVSQGRAMQESVRDSSHDELEKVIGQR